MRSTRTCDLQRKYHLLVTNLLPLVKKLDHICIKSGGSRVEAAGEVVMLVDYLEYADGVSPVCWFSATVASLALWLLIGLSMHLL